MKNYKEHWPEIKPGEPGYLPSTPHDDDARDCGAHGEGGYTCTRYRGHRDRLDIESPNVHAAHGMAGYVFATWED